MNINYDPNNHEYQFLSDSYTKNIGVKMSRGNAKRIWDDMDEFERSNFCAAYLNNWGKAVAVLYVGIGTQIFYFMRFNKEYVISFSDEFYPYVYSHMDDTDKMNFEAFVGNNLFSVGNNAISNTEISTDSASYFKAVLDELRLNIEFEENWFKVEPEINDSFLEENYSTIFWHFFGELENDEELSEAQNALHQSSTADDYWRVLYAGMQTQVIPSIHQNYIKTFGVKVLNRSEPINSDNLMEIIHQFFTVGFSEVEMEEMNFTIDDINSEPEEEDIELNPIWGSFINSLDIDDDMS